MTPMRPDTAPVDGHRPATRESWFCPSCGQPSPAFISVQRVVVCLACRWLFEVTLLRHFNAVGPDPVVSAQAYAEQVEPAEILARETAARTAATS